MSFLQTKEQLALLLSVVSGGVGYEKETEYSGKGVIRHLWVLS